MMKAAESGAGDYCRSQRRLAFHWPSIRRVLIKGIVNSVVVVVVHVIANEPPQVLFVQRDDMVENLSAAASYPAFRGPVLPGCLNTRALGLHASSLQEGNHIRIEISSRGRRWHNDMDQPRETLHAVVSRPTRQSDDE